MPATAIRVPPLARIRLGRSDDARLGELAAAGDERAFEALYDRHHRALLGFCRHMLGSPEEAEDALQQTFLRAHRALVLRGSPDEVRPWLYTIARNRCLSMLAARKPDGVPVEDAEPAIEGLGAAVERRADLRALVGDIARLPQDQRAALVLSELADLSHAEIADVIGVPHKRVKALVHQARTRLLAEREARELPCEQVREQLSTARGGELRRGPLRRHVAVCEPCRDYRGAVREQRAALGLVLPAIPSAGLKEAVLGALGGGGGGAVAAITGGGGLGAKLAIGVVVAGGAGGGAVAIKDAADPPQRAVPASAAQAATPKPAPAAAAPAGTPEQAAIIVTLPRAASAPARRGSPERRRARVRRGQERRSHTPAGTDPAPPGQSVKGERLAARREAKAERTAEREQRKAAKVPAGRPLKRTKPAPRAVSKPVKVKPVRTPTRARPRATATPDAVATVPPGQGKQEERIAASAE